MNMNRRFYVTIVTLLMVLLNAGSAVAETTGADSSAAGVKPAKDLNTHGRHLLDPFKDAHPEQHVTSAQGRMRRPLQFEGHGNTSQALAGFKFGDFKTKNRLHAIKPSMLGKDDANETGDSNSKMSRRFWAKYKQLMTARKPLPPVAASKAGPKILNGNAARQYKENLRAKRNQKGLSSAVKRVNKQKASLKGKDISALLSISKDKGANPHRRAAALKQIAETSANPEVAKALVNIMHDRQDDPTIKTAAVKAFTKTSGISTRGNTEK